MRQRTIALVGTSSGTLQHAVPRRTLVPSAPTLSTSTNSAPRLAGSYRDHSIFCISPARRRQDEVWQAQSVRWAHVQHHEEGRKATSSAATGQQGGDGFPPPSVPPQRRRQNSSGALSAKRTAGSSSAFLRGKSAARDPTTSRGDKAAAPKSDVDRVSTTVPEDPPAKEQSEGETVPLPDDPNAPSRKKEAPSKDTLKTPSPNPRQDPQGIKEQEKKKTIKERIIGLWENVKYLFRFYYNGVKQIWKNRTMVAEMQKAIAEREQQGRGGMMWLEKKVIELHRSDIRKLPLFLAILIILEEILPLVVIYAPSLLPSTCVLPSQATKMQSEEERRRGVAIQKLAADEVVTATVSRIDQDAADGKSTKEAAQATSLSEVSSPTLAQLADVFALRTWGPKSMILSRLHKHLGTLQEDDAYLRRAYDERHTTSQWSDICNGIWLQRASAQRGLRAFEASEADMVRNLEAYLHLAKTDGSTLEHALLPLALYDGTRSHLVRLEIERTREQQKGLRQRTTEVVESVVNAEKRKEAQRTA